MIIILGNGGGPLLVPLVCQSLHEWPSLVQIEVKYVIQMGADSDFVLCVVLIQALTVSSHHHLRNLLPLIEFPSIICLDHLLWIKSVVDIF